MLNEIEARFKRNEPLIFGKRDLPAKSGEKRRKIF
jgi:hypothetical protein